MCPRAKPDQGKRITREHKSQDDGSVEFERGLGISRGRGYVVCEIVIRFNGEQREQQKTPYVIQSFDHCSIGLGTALAQYNDARSNCRRESKEGQRPLVGQQGKSVRWEVLQRAFREEQ